MPVVGIVGVRLHGLSIVPIYWVFFNFFFPNPSGCTYRGYEK